MHTRIGDLAKSTGARGLGLLLGGAVLAVIAHSVLIGALVGVSAVAVLLAGVVCQLGIAFERGWIRAEANDFQGEALGADLFIAVEDSDVNRSVIQPR